MCGRQVDDSDTVEMPNGLICLDPCYMWLERMMDEAEEMEEEIFFEDDEMGDEI
jgi:hypothetical protein